MAEKDKPKPLSDHPLWRAVESGDVERARQLLEDDRTLATKDYRLAKDQDPHTDGYPLARAAELGDLEMVRLLLGFGADIDAKSPHEEQRELGSPIMLALEGRHYDVMHLLLDRGASVHAYGYCYPALVELLYEESLKAGAPKELARRGFDGYLGKATTEPVAEQIDEPEVVRLFNRVLDLGGQPSMESLVLGEYYELIDELIRTCPESPGTRHDHPPGTVFETLCQSAGWHGFPKVLEIAMARCPGLFTRDLSLDCLERALVSHNREGLASDFYRLIETQLQYLKREGHLASILEQEAFRPHCILARNYLWPGWYGNERGPSSVAEMINLSELFQQYGFVDLTNVDPETGETALAHARSRSEHPGLTEFADYLEKHGAV